VTAEFVDIEVCGKLFTVQVTTELTDYERTRALEAAAADIRKHLKCDKQPETFWEESNG
jgi:hypothetical protein